MSLVCRAKASLLAATSRTGLAGSFAGALLHKSDGERIHCVKFSVISDCYEQLDTDDVQDPELGRVQSFTEAARIAIDLV
jgi:hypothetical protein